MDNCNKIMHTDSGNFQPRVNALIQWIKNEICANDVAKKLMPNKNPILFFFSGIIIQNVLITHKSFFYLLF